MNWDNLGMTTAEPGIFIEYKIDLLSAGNITLF
jgi:hypothetical protein